MRWRIRAAVENRVVGTTPNDENWRRLCQTCQHFQSDPRLLEALIPGLVSFGSGNASVCADDGLCLHHARYVAASAGCVSYQPQTHG
jgi:hypothetical protein